MKPFDPNKTDPCFEQLISDEEVIELARCKNEKRDNEKNNPHPESMNSGLNGRPEGPARDFAPELPEFSQGETSMSGFLLWLIFPSALEPSEITRRRTLVLSLSVVVLFLLTALSYGGLSFLGFGGFARADMVMSIRVDQLWQMINTAAEKGCKAESEDTRISWEADAIKKLAELNRIQAGYIMPTCKKVVSK